MARYLNDQGVSVIVGTLLLILITVTAAAGLAVMVSQMQKDEMNRQTHLAAVKNENIAISGVSLANNGSLWAAAPNNISGSQNWSAISFNLMNLNTQDVSIMGIAINNYYAYPLNFSSLSLTSGGYCNLTTSGGGCLYLDPAKPGSHYLTIPAGGSARVTMGLTASLNSNTAPRIGTGDQIDIKILTSLTNIFEQTYRLPTPVIVYNTETVNLANNIQQDRIVLDGSQSSAVNVTIVGWNWTIMDASGTQPTPGNCSDTDHLVLPGGISPVYSGKILHISPSTTGPFCANLTVTDSNGMVATTPQDQLIPQDAQFIPAANLIATFNDTYSPPLINVTIKDVNGHPVSNAAVNYIIDINQFGNLSLSNYVGTTDGQGMSSANVSCGIGTVKVVSGQLPSSIVAVHSNGC